MSIPGVCIKAVKGYKPCNREGVGGSIKAISQFNSNFTPCLIVKAIDGDEDMFFRSPAMNGVSWTLSGVTKDSAGAVLGSCVVQLFYTLDDVFLSHQISDPTTGVFKFQASPNAAPYYMTAYKPGGPDVAGITVNTLTPVAT